MLSATGNPYKYKLPSELYHSTLRRPTPYFRNSWLWIAPSADDRRAADIAISTGYAWDGCTLAPDARGTHDASCIHDAVYQFAEAIAGGSGWTVRRVLRYGDELFRERMLADGAAGATVYSYYWAVRVFGYAFHQAARRVRGPADRREKKRRLFWRFKRH
ncbi:MAG: hypothetical protein PHR35_11955 [Kiritimatiellae bacterium]|nr:hypothetical protein [Kiritimatiellia bacterium]